MENKKLKEENAKIPELEKQIEKLQLELEELKAMKFGKKRNNKKTKAYKLPSGNKKQAPQKRTAKSYRRSIPLETDVTDELRLELENCSSCGEALEKKKDHTHYREDLHTVEDLLKSAQKIVETIVESGKSEHCNKRQLTGCLLTYFLLLE